MRYTTSRFAEVVCALTLALCGVIQAMADPAPGPEEICLNTVGYLTAGPKLATLTVPAEIFELRSLEPGRTVFRGTPSPVSGFNGCWVADFSKFREAGAYKLVVGEYESPPFRIDANPYRPVFEATFRAMTLMRCGCAVHAEVRGDRFAHGPCHLAEAELEYVEGAGRRDATGGWHDAGDYNKYVVNGAFSAGLLLMAWDHFSERLKLLAFDLPERGGKTPDFLDEIRWELDWLLKMQAADGGVYHKLSTLEFGGFVLPEQEQAKQFFSPAGTSATACFAAVTAHAARVYVQYDPEFSRRCLAAAEHAGAYLAAHPQNQAPDLSAFKTGPYDSHDFDDRIWAAAELWEATGKRSYLQQFERRIRRSLQRVPQGAPASAKTTVDADWDWSNVRNLGVFVYLKSQRAGRAEDLVKQIRNDLLQTADAHLNTGAAHPYGRSLGEHYYWGSNGTLARHGVTLHLATQLTDDPKYHEALLAGLDHLLGRNPYGRSYVTGVGYNPPRFPHDRRSAGDQVDAPWPGYLVGGPWSKATDWVDNQEDFRTNEIALNWNASLIYAVASVLPDAESPANP